MLSQHEQKSRNRHFARESTTLRSAIPITVLLSSLVIQSCKTKPDQAAELREAPAADGSPQAAPDAGVMLPIGDALPGGLRPVFELFAAKVAPALHERGVRLSLTIDAQSTNLDAHAERGAGPDWTIEVEGGFLSNPDVSPDIMLLTICHELGHLLGGKPRRRFSQLESLNSEFSGLTVHPWFSSEGQADYFASQRCMKAVLSDQDNSTAIAAHTPDPDARKLCESAEPDAQRAALCLRIVYAGFDLITVLGKTGFGFSTPDQSKVPKTFIAPGIHLPPQCRLDTFIAGALCDKPPVLNGDNDNPLEDSCSSKGGRKAGARPRCWFKE